MRLWSLHPRYLDRQGLLALWREALLAQKVLMGQTRGYRCHPQLQRFREHPQPLQAMAVYLSAVEKEARERGYHFDKTKILHQGSRKKIPLTRGQLAYEREHLAAKLKERDPKRLQALPQIEPKAHPLFLVVEGPIADWEVVK